MKKIILFLPIFILAAALNISVNKKTLTAGEELIITLSAKGKNVKFPTLTKIDGVNIVGTSDSSSISIINGEMRESVTRSFILYPTKDLTIPPLTVYIDGKKFQTKPIHIKVIAPTQTKGDYELDINLSKKTLYLGESAIFTIKFIQKKRADSIQIQSPHIDGFLLKEISQNQENKNTAKIITYKFLAIPQEAKSYEIGPLIAQVGHIVKINQNDFFGLQIASMKYKTIYSNKIKVDVKPIPKGAIFGDFNISLKAKTQVKANTPNKITLTIKGCGDFYSLNNFNLKIPNVTIYPSKPIKNIEIKNNKLCGTFTQQFTIIADNSYKIPPITLKTFDGKLHIKKTKPIFIKVINPIKTNKTRNIINNQLPKTPQKITKNNNSIILAILISLIIGILIGILIFYLITKYNNSLYKKIKNANEKELLNILKIYQDNEKIKNIIEKIEENLYKNANNKIDKKEIYKIIKKLK